ncbi:MAG: hypothetical protein L3J36_10015 [Rhodobacteraceae bacterium]|nr:hypothetical protein [Paracoccaceae bacterium]
MAIEIIPMRDNMKRIFVLLIGLALIAGCTAATPEEPLEALGEFKLGHNIVVAGKTRRGPVSRKATEGEWVNALTTAIDERFSQYQGSQLYHFGISVEGYMLAPEGLPLVYTPKSALIINVTLWDDAAGKKLNEKVEQLTIFETTTSGSFLIGSGHNRTKEEQLMGLSRNAVGRIEEWMLEQHLANGWFAKKSGTEPLSTPPDES